MGLAVVALSAARPPALPLDRVLAILTDLFGQDLHAKRILSIAVAGVGVVSAGMPGAAAIGKGLAAMASTRRTSRDLPPTKALLRLMTSTRGSSAQCAHPVLTHPPRAVRCQPVADDTSVINSDARRMFTHARPCCPAEARPIRRERKLGGAEVTTLLWIALVTLAYAADPSERIRDLHASGAVTEALAVCEKLTARGGFTAESIQACADVDLELAGDDLDKLREVVRRWGSSEAGQTALRVWSKAVLNQATDEAAIGAWPVAARGEVGRADAEARWADAMAAGDVGRLQRLGVGFRGLRTPDEVTQAISALERRTLLEGPLAGLIGFALAHPDDGEAASKALSRAEALGGLAFVPNPGVPGAGTLERLPLFLRPEDAAKAPSPRTDPTTAALVRTGPEGPPPKLHFVGSGGVVTDAERSDQIRAVGLTGWVRDDLRGERYDPFRTCVASGIRAVIALPVDEAWVYAPVHQPEDCKARQDRITRSASVQWGEFTLRLGAPVRDLVDARLAQVDASGTLQLSPAARVAGAEVKLHVHADRLAAVEVAWKRVGDLDQHGITHRLAVAGGAVSVAASSRRVVDGVEQRWTCRQDRNLTVLQSDTGGTEGAASEGRMLVTATSFAGWLPLNAELARDPAFRRGPCGEMFDSEGR